MVYVHIEITNFHFPYLLIIAIVVTIISAAKSIAQEESKAEAEEQLGLELVAALEGSSRLVPLSNQEKHLPWGARAISVYRVSIYCL